MRPAITADAIIATHPAGRATFARQIVAAVDEAAACAIACTSCADACLAEPMVDRLRQCIRACLDCADVCAATARLATRRTGSNAASNAALLTEMLAVCATACHLCGEECTRHADMHDHCRLCAEACLACAETCQRAMGDVG